MSKQFIDDNAIVVTSIDDGPDPTPEPPETPLISIDLPADGAKVVGSVPGITVNLSGSGWVPFGKRPRVKVQIGATDTFHEATSVSGRDLHGNYFWSHTGVTVAGGPITVTARVSVDDLDLVTSTDNVQLAVNDTPPLLGVEHPFEGELYVGTDAGKVITVNGTASSIFAFGTRAIVVRVDEQEKAATTVVNGVWSTTVPVPKDNHVVKIICTNVQGISTTITRNVVVTAPTGILDVNLTSYLQALIKFATDAFALGRSRIATVTPVGQATNITVNDLVQNFRQKFDLLPTFPAKANVPLHQIRVCIEVLRSYLATLPANPPLAAALAVQEGRYRQAAYFALLSQLGTSFDEIRTTPTAPPEKRQALADRLGITRGASRPDNLDKLFLDPSAPAGDPKALTELKLEEIFGLIDTTRDPFLPDLNAQFIGWQLDYLLQEWRDRDFPLVPIADALPIIDPDLLIKGDFKNPVASDAAFNLFTTRQSTVQGWVVELQNKRVSATQLAALNAMLLSVLQKQAPDLVTMDDDQLQGQDISTVLNGMKLDQPGFTYLVRVSRLLIGSASASLLESEWSDVVNILIQVKKKKKFQDWRTEEQAANPNLSLSPNYFQSPAALPVIRSTGTDAAGSLLSEGAIDPNWTITAKPGGVTGSFPAFATKGDPVWFPNRNSSRWISTKPDARTNELPGNYTYRTSFDLTGYDLTTVQIRMQISVDDELVDVKLNGQSTGLKVPIFADGSAFMMSREMQITSGFVAGMNTLEFIVNNQNVGNNPTGIQAQMEFASVPQRLPVPTWRAIAHARQDWESTLNGRIEQQKSVVDAFASVIDQVEEATLPMLRNAIVAGIGKDADWLTQRLLIDVKADGQAQTTRLNQAIETVQNLFFGLRNSDPPVDLPTWKLNFDSRPETNSQFDEQWNSIGSYAGWRAAMLVFLYPENLLTPTLRPANQHTAAFRTFQDDVRAAMPLTRDAAATIVAAYLTEIAKPNSGFPSGLLPLGFTITEQATEAVLIAYSVVLAGVWGNANDTQKRSLAEVFFDVPITIASHFQQGGDFEAALDWYRLVYALDLAPDRRRIYPLLNDEKTIVDNYSQTSQWLLDDAVNPHQFARTRKDAYTRFTLMSIVRCMLSFADSEFTTDSFESLPRARSLYINARDVLDMPELSRQPSDGRVKMNPVLPALRGLVEVNLFKLRTQRNIAGMQRQVPSLIAQPVSFILGNGSNNGRAVNTGTSLAPTQYRYATLIERAKQLVTIAQQIEASFLASLEKRDAEAYSILKARQDLDLSSAHLTLQNLRVTEAADGLLLAGLQQQKAQFQVDHYQGLLNADLIAAEVASLGFIWAQFGLQTVATAGYAATTTFNAILAVATLGLAGGKATESAAQVFGSAAAVAGIQAGIQDKIASYERRKQEWQYQADLGRKDKQITDQQYQIALDQQKVVLQEQSIANLQSQHADATVNFLATKFTNVELYEYMSGILQGVYSYFLQQASAMARMAQNQLAFERQEATLSFIQADYWQPPSEGSSTSNSNAPDRRGMTGSARLLQDIFELDQHAFATNQRKLQLTKTISLAQMAPFEFQKFRETGVLPIAMPRQLFDQDFPGHYLRLIRRVRTSVIALIPPTQGIKATLFNTGVSRTTVAGPAFQDVVVRRDPQSVALTSPMNATGLFELDTQPELLLPFEGLGVDTSWEFQMPRAANFINYDAIADVLITIEYTALSDAVYRDQVIQRLDRDFAADRAISFQQVLSDQWYDIHNPEQLEPAKRFRAEFSIADTDFPLNLEKGSLKTSNLIVYFVPENGQPINATTVGLSFVPEGAPPLALPLGGDAQSAQGVLSTRSGSAADWRNCNGVAPFGKWTLDLSRDAGLQALLAADKIRDILFVVSYTAQTAKWPN
jgi:hypothetical protein